MCWARVRVASMEGVTCAWACCQPQVPSQSLVLGWFHSGTGQALRAGLPRPAGSSPLSSAHRAQPSPGRPRGGSLRAVRLQCRPDAHGQRSWGGALRSAAHRQAPGSQGAGSGGANGCELQRGEGASGHRQVPGEAGGWWVWGLSDILLVRTPLGM